MTKNELIEELSKIEGNLQVFIYTDCREGISIDDFTVAKFKSNDKSYIQLLTIDTNDKESNIEAIQ